MSRVVVFGAGGRLGSRVAIEALSRSHSVVAAVSDRNQAPVGTMLVVADASNEADVRKLAAGSDVLVVAVGGPDKTVYVRAARTLVDILPSFAPAAPRIIHIGGGGSLLNGEGVRLLDTPAFPQEIREEALGQAAALECYRASVGVTWTFMSPPPGSIEAGERRGLYRAGLDHPVTDADGIARISVEDYAVALVDEIEAAAHLNERFTVGY